MEDSTLLPSAYYLGDFLQVVAGVQARCGFLLNAAEHAHLAKLAALGRPALLLYARLVNRRGPCFRVAKLVYSEISEIGAAVAELLAAGLLLPCDGALPPELQARLLACFTHAELRDGLDHRPKHARKPELLDWLAKWDGCRLWLDGLLQRHPRVRIAPDDPWPFLRFLFFGGLRDNLADFVTRALGHIVTETVAPERLTAPFADRRQADDAYRMALLYAAFRRGRRTQTPAAMLAWWQAQGVTRAALTAGQDGFDRLVERLGGLLEQVGEIAAALTLYGSSPVAARERRARLLVKTGQPDAARALLRAMLDAPASAAEAAAARRLLARLDRTRCRNEARYYQRESAALVLAYQPGRVEAAVLAHYQAAGWQGVHSENWLWNGVLGLLLWDIIYDPAAGGFHCPLQFGPSDLHEPAFYARRAPAIEARLALLAEPAAALALLRRHWVEKQGIANPFVAWHETLPELAEIMVRRLPAAGLAAALRHLARDVRGRASGLPDLFLWTASDYRFVEIKGENDQLADHQYAWLRFLAGAGIKVALEKVARPAGDDGAPILLAG